MYPTTESARTSTRPEARVEVRLEAVTEYERLADACARACRRQEAFIEEGQIFADALTDAFGDFLECPRGSIAFQPEDVDLRAVGLKLFVPEQAVKLRRDGWFGFRVTIQVGPARFVSFPLSFQRSGDASWAARLTRATEEFQIADSLDGADAAFEAWVDLAAARLATRLDDLVRDGENGAAVEIDIEVRD